MAKPSKAPASADTHPENPTHPTEAAFFERLIPLLTQPDGHRIAALREVRVPAQTMSIDALVDFRGSQLGSGLMQQIAPWCANRLVALEYESGTVSAHTMKNLIAKANAARTGRRQGRQRWGTVELSRPMTLLVVAEKARSVWFEEWGLPVREICRGLWVHENDLLTIVVVRPYWLGQHSGAHLWGMVATQIAESTALRLFRHLLGDPSTATFYKTCAASILQTHYPESPVMNQRQAEVEEQPVWNASNSRWHQLLELHLQKEELEAEVQALRKQAEEQRVQVEEQRVQVEEQRVQVEEQRVQVEEQRVQVEEHRARADEQSLIAKQLRAELEHLQAIK
jgi:hypothetical protein